MNIRTLREKHRAVVARWCKLVLPAGLGVAALALAGCGRAVEETPEAARSPITVSSRALDFGAVPLHEAQERLLVLRNDGPEPVRAELVVDSDEYTVDPSSVLLHPGLATSVSVTTRPNRQGELDNRLSIRLEDESSDVQVKLRVRAGETPTEIAKAEPWTPQNGETKPLRAKPVSTLPKTATNNGMPGVLSVPVARGASSNQVNPETRIAQADGLAPRQGGNPTTQPGAGTNPTTPTGANANDGDTPRRNYGLQVRPFDPATSVAPGNLAEPAPPIPTTVTESDKERAIPIDDEPLTPEELDDQARDLEEEEDDIFDDDSEDQETPPQPHLTVFPSSTTSLLGNQATFYPQELPISGSVAGGSVVVGGQIYFPQNNLAMGESAVYRQTGPLFGTFDPGTGHVELVLPIEVVDNDNKAVPFQLQLTTGRVYTRDVNGNVLFLEGTPRSADRRVRLVAAAQIPVGAPSAFTGYHFVIDIRAELVFPSEVDIFGRNG